VILAHIASIVVAIDKRNPGRHAPDDETLAPLLKRLQTSVIQLTSEVGGGRRDGPSEPSSSASTASTVSTASTASTLTIVREAFVDLYPSLFGRACCGCTSARVTYLSCLQTLVKTDPKAFHGDWPRLLGGATSEPPEPSDQAKSGLYVHLGDEAPKVRHAVAASISTLIEGPAQRAYLSMATVPGGDNKVKSFISLSEVLGRMVVANVEALQAGVARACSSRDAEDDVACAAMVRAMTTFLVGSWGLGGGGAGAGAGGGRMPAGLAWRCVAALLTKVDVGDVRDSPSDDVVVACLGSLASIFGTNGIISIKQGADETAANDRERMDAALDVLMRRLASAKSTRIKLEAAAALRGALRCDGGSRGAEDDDRFLPLAPLVAETKVTLAGATTAKRKEIAKKKKEHSNKERLTQQLVLLFGDVGIADWELAAAAAGHPSARIRAAAFASLASMCARRSDGSIGGRPAGRLDGRLDDCLDLAEAHADEAAENESTVRSSAVKAYLEVLMAISRDKERTRSHALAPFVSSQTLDTDNANDHDPSTIHPNAYRPQRVVRVVASSLKDSVLAVRINAAVLAADISATIWHSSMEHIADAWRDPTTRQHGLAMLSELLHAAVEACRDHEKVAVHSVRALGYVAGAIIRLGGRTDVLDPRADAIVSVLDSCMSRGKNGKKELAWSCAEAVTVASMLDTEQDDELIARMRVVVNP